MSNDKIAEIRERHARDAEWSGGWAQICPRTHDDRATLLAEDERHRAEIERLRKAMTNMMIGWRHIRREREEYRAEVERLRDQIYESIPKWQANELQREINQLRDAMQFYADPNRYKSTSVHMCGHSTGQSVMIDGGRKAREALGVKS